jgi:hypothetical protein
VEPAIALSEAARILKPMQQGELDGLCGVYAVINAARLVLWPEHELSYEQLRAAFAIAVAELARSKRLRNSVSEGVLPAPLLRLGKVVAGAIEAMTGARVGVTLLSGATNRTALLRVIRRHLGAGHPLILGFEGKHEHWTVATGLTATRVVLFDCSGLRWVETAKLGHTDDRPVRLHRIGPDGVIAVRPARRRARP